MASLGSFHPSVARATCAFCRHRHIRNCRSCDEVASFIHAESAAAQTLVAYYDSCYPGINGIFHRALVDPKTKTRHALAESRHHLGCKPQAGKWLRRHATMVALASFVLLLPMMLSPTHPIAVYFYLAEYYLPFGGPAASPATDGELRAFLLSERQLSRYRTDLQDDVWAVNTGKLFTIVRRHDGALEQRGVRTWNEFLPNRLPAFIVKRLDRKEISFLGDVVDAYLHSARIEAMGHYHSYGGPPSRGDQLAGQVTKLPEIVVSNGIYPMVYLRGSILDFGPVAADNEVLKAVARLDEGLQSGAPTENLIPRAATDTTMSFLSYLRYRRGVDIQSLDAIRNEVLGLCADFRGDFRSLYKKDMDAYEQEDLDVYQLLHNVGVLDGWATFGLERRGWTLATFAGAGSAPGKSAKLD